MEYYSAIKKKEMLSFATVWMDLENIMLSEIITWYLSFYDWLTLLSIILSRSIHAVAKGKISFFFMAE